MFIGVGCGFFGHGMGEIISHKLVKKHPEIDQQIKNEKQDEHNITIENSAKAKAFDKMIFIFGTLMLVFVLMGVETVAILLLTFAYLVIIGY